MCSFAVALVVVRKEDRHRELVLWIWKIQNAEVVKAAALGVGAKLDGAAADFSDTAGLAVVCAQRC